MGKKGWFSMENLKGISKNQLLVGGLAGILLLVIALPTEQGKKPEGGGSETQSGAPEEKIYTDPERYGRELERQLGQILAEMEGVGKVEVMITLQDDGERIVEKDITRNSQEVLEGDGETKRETRESLYQEGSVFGQETGQEGQPFVSKEVVPKVEGVLVVAEGGGNAKTVKNISDAVLALFPVEVHKIKVVKMN